MSMKRISGSGGQGANPGELIGWSGRVSSVGPNPLVPVAREKHEEHVEKESRKIKDIILDLALQRMRGAESERRYSSKGNSKLEVQKNKDKQKLLMEFRVNAPHLYKSIMSIIDCSDPALISRCPNIGVGPVDWSQIFRSATLIYYSVLNGVGPEQHLVEQVETSMGGASLTEMVRQKGRPISIMGCGHANCVCRL